MWTIIWLIMIIWTFVGHYLYCTTTLVSYASLLTVLILETGFCMHKDLK